MRIFKPLALAAFALIAFGLLAVPSAQAGTRVNISFGGGGYCAPPAYYPRPVAYCPPAYYPRPYYAQPVYYQPAYYPAPRPVYYGGRGYGYPANYGYRPAYYTPGCR